MNIQWFPGHMTKATRLIEENLKLVDGVGYMLDARAPRACMNPVFDKLTQGKEVIYILNKTDLADIDKVNKFINELSAEGKKTIKLNALNGGVKPALQAFNNIENNRLKKFESKGIYTPTRIMIIGIPNCGKSTLINAAAGKKAAVTGDRPGVTKNKQWVRLSEGLELLDTPGTLWGRIDDEECARQLVYIGSIKDDIIDIVELAPFMLTDIAKLYPNALNDRYKIILPIKADWKYLMSYARNVVSFCMAVN
jgi:ribosome biogenesis GTP-binding protein YlqF